MALIRGWPQASCMSCWNHRAACRNLVCDSGLWWLRVCAQVVAATKELLWSAVGLNGSYSQQLQDMCSWSSAWLVRDTWWSNAVPSKQHLCSISVTGYHSLQEGLRSVHDSFYTAVSSDPQLVPLLYRQAINLRRLEFLPWPTCLDLQTVSLLNHEVGLGAVSQDTSIRAVPTTNKPDDVLLFSIRVNVVASSWPQAVALPFLLNIWEYKLPDIIEKCFCYYNSIIS